jgi:hypothetical protein
VYFRNDHLRAKLNSVEVNNTVGQRKMKILAIITMLAAVVSTGCMTMAGSPKVDVEIVNHSSHDFENAKADFGSFECKWGWVIKTTTAVYAFYPHPITAKAVLSWSEKERGPQSVELDLVDSYPQGAAGRLTFTVSDSGVKVGFRKE